MGKKLDEQQFSALALLAGIYPLDIPATSDVAMDAWSHFLRDIPGDTLFRVAEEWIRTESRAPKPADILAAVAALDGNDAESAWAAAQRIVMGGRYRDGEIIRPRGFTGDLRLEDAVQAAGGWRFLGRADERATTFAKKEFLDGWKSAGRRIGVSAALGDGQRQIGEGA